MTNNTNYHNEIAIDEDNMINEAENNTISEDEDNLKSNIRKMRRGRGKASGDLKLNSKLLEQNKLMQEKFIQLRQSIFVPKDWAKQERIRHQRHVLAIALNVHDKLVRAIEKTPSTLPGTVLFALIEHYNLPANYFTNRDVSPSERFYIEQKIKEFEYNMGIGTIANSRNDNFIVRNNKDTNIRKGGWLRGLPRKAKNSNDAYLLAVWAEAKRHNYSPSTIDDMIKWVKDNNISVNTDSITIATKNKKRQETVRSKGRSTMRRGGWMLGLPRSPRTDEQKEQVRIWHIARERNLQFTSVQEMMTWWASEEQK